MHEDSFWHLCLSGTDEAESRRCCSWKAPAKSPSEEETWAGFEAHEELSQQALGERDFLGGRDFPGALEKWGSFQPSLLPGSRQGAAR